MNSIELLIFIVCILSLIFVMRKSQSNKSIEKELRFSNKDNLLKFKANRLEADLKSIEKSIADIKTGKKNTPEEIESFWNKND